MAGRSAGEVLTVAQARARIKRNRWRLREVVMVRGEARANVVREYTVAQLPKTLRVRVPAGVLPGELPHLLRGPR
jgi:hypothetical protein